MQQTLDPQIILLIVAFVCFIAFNKSFKFISMFLIKLGLLIALLYLLIKVFV